MKYSGNSFTRVGSPSGGGLALHSLEVARPVIILTRRYTEQQVGDGNQPIALNCQEGEKIKALQGAPHELEGGAASLRQGAHTSRLTKAYKEQPEEKSSSSTNPNAHLFMSADNKAVGRGVPSSIRLARDKRRQATIT